MYKSFNEVHSMPGLVLSSTEIPATEGDMTGVEPVENEMRCDGANLYVATTVVAGTSVVWTKTALTAWA